MGKTILHNDWAPFLTEEFDKPYYIRLRAFLAEEYRTATVHPDAEDIFNALRYTSFAETKVVILGQDPYHGPGQAHGLSFSVRPGVQPPPSLANIFKELASDLGIRPPGHGCLTAWARRGVLLLNTVLTVRDGKPASHRGKGWESFTDRVISVLNQKDTPVVFILWGAPAQSKQNLIDTSKHHVIRSPHPSPLSARRGFFGSRPFSAANRYLEQAGLEPVDWHLPESPTLDFI